MIVCVCEGINDREVLAAIGGGARTLKQLGTACKAGTGCGACHAQLQSLLKQHAAAGTDRPRGVRRPPSTL